MNDGKILGWRSALAALALAGSLGATGCSSMGNGFGGCCLLNRHEPPLAAPIQAPAPAQVVTPPASSAVTSSPAPTSATTAMPTPPNPAMPSQ